MQDQLPHVYGMSDRVFLLGEVHCVGNEPELLECSHTSIGVHSCGRDATSIPNDIIISCRGMLLLNMGFGSYWSLTSRSGVEARL